jgi:hypothetical protein
MENIVRSGILADLDGAVAKVLEVFVAFADPPRLEMVTTPSYACLRSRKGWPVLRRRRAYVEMLRVSKGFPPRGRVPCTVPRSCGSCGAPENLLRADFLSQPSRRITIQL